MVARSRCLLLFGSIAGLVLAGAQQGPGRCIPAYNTSSGRASDRLNVHLVAHTHDDSGWLKTVEQYYFGSKQWLQNAGVQYILDTVVAALAANPDRKFVYAEMSFFTMWWSEQTEETRALVRRLVERGQLDFVNGGYVQHDEAASHYVSMIDQTTRGHTFLNATFGKVDPFGHSATQASLLAGYLGFDALYFGRSDYQDLALRSKALELEMLWRGARSYGTAADVFCGSFASGNYGPVPGFAWEWTNWDAPIQDNLCFEEVNVGERVADFVARALEVAAVTAGPDIMLTFGTDFNYENAFVWFKNMDKLIHHVNADGRINAFYSTPAAYTAAKHAYHQAWPLKTDDFFPYADCPSCYWTGYFTSRPASKGYIRAGSAFLQAARQLAALSALGRAPPAPGPAGYDSTERLEAAVALLQHHDAITGTEKQAVAGDYHRRLAAGWAEAGASLVATLEQLVAGTSARQGQAARPAARAAGARGPELGQPPFGLRQCLLLNASVCEASVEASARGEAVTVALWNPLGWPRVEGVRVPVSLSAARAWRVEDSEGQEVLAQLLPVANATTHLQLALNASGALTSPLAAASYEVAFLAKVPPLGYASYTLKPLRGAQPAAGLSSVERIAPGSVAKKARHFTLAAGNATLTFCARSGALLAYAHPSLPAAVALRPELVVYNSSDEKGPSGHDWSAPSGAYLFRPNGAATFDTPTAVDVVSGDLLTEVRQEFLEWAALTLRVWHHTSTLEAEWTAGPLPFEDNRGRELSVRYVSGVASGRVLHTDANGREWQRRVRDQRPTWALDVHEPVAGNYYPLTAGAYLEDEEAQLAVLTDRAQGGASLRSGELELMVHRRTLKDDWRGVAEPLNETDCGCRECACAGLSVRGSHHLLLTAPETGAEARRSLQQRLNDPLVLAFGAAGLWQAAGEAAGQREEGPLLQRGKKGGRGSFLGLADGLPRNVHLLTLKPAAQGQLLLRLAHLYQVGERAAGLNETAEVDLDALLAGVAFEAALEVTLSAGKPLSQVNKLEWKAGRDMTIRGHGAAAPHAYRREPPLECSRNCTGKLVVRLQPMDIRTFLLRPAAGRASAAAL